MPSDIEGSCEFIEQAVADSRQGVVLQPRTWTGPLVRRKRDMRFGTVIKPSLNTVIKSSLRRSTDGIK
jgi:hypothetical protein